MKFKSATIKDFKRFTNLTVLGIPETARLIILAGPNGCGKSSFFDALHVWYKWTSRNNHYWEIDYHSKTGSPNRNELSDNVKLEFHSSLPGELKKILYVRSAYRNDPEFRIRRFERAGDLLDEERVNRMIENDAAVSQNYKRLVSQGIEDLYNPEKASTTFGEYQEESFGEIQQALSKLFSNLKLDSLTKPLQDGTFRFTKGTSKGFAFKNLSGGEKAAFDLILDIVVAKRSYDNTVFCIDEPESHMNMRLQAELLSVLYELIPENCQLMLATHSIGMMRRAQDIENENPGSVVLLDFDLDFDQPQVIEPTMPDRKFWKKAYDVALDDLAALVAPSHVVICEGQMQTQNPVNNHSHDARCYERIFETEFPETRFVSMGNDREVLGDRHGLAQALLSLVDGLEVVRLIDRDDRTDTTVADLRENGVRVLARRNLESYLFDDEVLRELAESAGQGDKAEELIEKKREIRAAITNGASDDLKPASGQIYVACKNILTFPSQPGNDTKEFMRDTLAPLIKPDMAIYGELKQDIFGSPEDT